MATVQQVTTPQGAYEQPTGLFINNEFVKGVKEQTIPALNPTTEKAICDFHEATAEDIDVAVAAARKAFEGPWSKVTPEDRGKLINKFVQLIERDAAQIAAVEALNNGKSLFMAGLDVGYCASTFRYYAGWADKIEGKVIDTNPDSFNYTKQEAIGVCGQIIPWNFPLVMFSWKVAPAIACGNTVVIKPDEKTPLSALYLAKLVVEAGFPPGVINIVTGYGATAGAAIASHMDIDKIAFTGSTGVGRSILKAAANSNLKKVTLELGGKSPNIVFNDADIAQAVSWAYFGYIFNAGQTCAAGTRLYVQEGIYDKFVEAFKARTAQTKLGDPFEADTFQGPQISQTQVDRIMGYIQSGKDEGAKLEMGGVREDRNGFFVQPTIFSNVTEDMKIMKEEIFGPVVSIAKFKTEEEAIRAANTSTYGLAGAVHTKDINTALRVSSALKAGTVWVNSYNLMHHQLPFGGFKESGIGRELGEAAIAAYTQTKTVSIRLGGHIF